MTKIKGTKNLRKMIPYFKGCKFLIFLTFLLQLIYLIFTAFEPLIISEIIINLTEGVYNNALYYVAIFLCVAIIKSLMPGFMTLTSNRWIKQGACNLKNDLFSKVLSINNLKLDTIRNNEIISRLGKNCYEVSYTYRKLITNLNSSIAGCIYIFIGFYYNFWISFYILITCLIILMLNVIFEKIRIKKDLEFDNLNDIYSSFKNEAIRGVKDVKMLGIKDKVIEMVDKNQRDYYSKQIAFYDKHTWLIFILNCVYAISYVGFFGISAWFMMNNWLSLATFVVLFMYIGKIRSSVLSLKDIKNDLLSGEKNAIRAFEFLNDLEYPKEKYGTINKNLVGKIEFKKVSFSYSDDKKLIENLSFKINPNSMIAFVGVSGIGKSTIISLIQKSVVANSGEILLDDVNINDLDEKSLVNSIGVVSQTPYIFNLTIKENLKLVKPDATDEEIEKICEKVQLSEYIKSLPDGYDSLLGENGIYLSGGQKQRLAIARVLLKDSKILLFDEATSALDNETQEKIKQVLNSLRENHTIIIVAHRLSTIVDCDKIFFLSENGVEAEGSHNELLQKYKPYKKLYKLETENDN